jgi:hypothetical protein
VHAAAPSGFGVWQPRCLRTEILTRRRRIRRSPSRGLWCRPEAGVATSFESGLHECRQVRVRSQSMRISARRTLTLQPIVLARMPTGDVLALSWKPLDAAFLDAYGPSLEPAWSREVRKDAWD